MMGMGFGAGFIQMVFFWVFVIGLAIWLLSNLFPRINDSLKPQDGDPSETALEILKQRYARGEVSEADYIKMREVLQTELR